MDPLLEVFVYENMQLLEQVESTLLKREKEAPLTKAQVDEVFRVMHTLKGSSAMMEYNNMAKLAHGVEDLFDVIRSNSVDPAHWEDILDLILLAIDFFKNELTKIQDGLFPDGEIDALYERKEQIIELLASGTQTYAAAPKEAAQSRPAASLVLPGDEPAAHEPLGEGEESVKYYRAHILFEKDCGMETIRAFGVVNALKGLYTLIKHIPLDIETNVDAEIAQKGFIVLMASAEDLNKIEGVLKKTILLKSLELCEIDETRFTTKEELKAQAPLKDAEPDNVSDMSLDRHVKQNFISVDVNRIDKLMNLVGEIVTSESMVVKNPEVAKLHLEGFEKQARLLRKLTNELQDVVMSIRMVPVSSSFLKMQRLVRDLGKKMGKEARFVMMGEKTEVDKNVNDLLADPLMHLIRNCMDHGLETKEERIAAGKSPVGTITLSARNTGGNIIITVTDDGRGLNKQAIVKKAREQGMTSKTEAEISDKEAFRYILMPGFSTKDAVTEYSGRGVGMDVVRKNIEKIGGSIYIESEKDKGTKFTLHIPLTLAIINGMKVVVGEEQYIIPILNIRESFEPRLHKTITSPDGMEMVIIRGQCYRVIRLHEKFNVPTEVTDFKKGIMVMVESELGRACVFVDKLVDEQQVVIKPLPANLAKVAGRSMGIAGCTIMGDGSISLILDVNGLITTNRLDAMQA